jgi:hypothetical protein
MATSCFDDSPLGVYHMTGDQAIPQGADWDVAIRYVEGGVPVSFTGFSARMQVRTDYDKTIILELNTSDGTIGLGDGLASDTTPNVILHFRSAVTSAMSQYEGIYDLEVTTTSGVVYKFLEGKFALRREITK